MTHWKPSAFVLLAVGLTQMLADLTGVDSVRAIAAATLLAPAPKVFSSVQGLETYSTRFFLEWEHGQLGPRSIELTPRLYARIKGPYNRRNVYGAVLAYGPVLAANERTCPLLSAVTSYGLTGDAPILCELGIDPAQVVGPLRLCYEPAAGTDMGTLARAIEVPVKCRGRMAGE